MDEFDYDLVVIGSGPAGHHAAIQAAKLRKRVMMAERKGTVGGVCVNVGTIPSKTIRESVLYLSGYRQHGIYGKSYRLKERITLHDLMTRVEPIVRHEIDVMRDQLQRNGVEVADAEASFLDSHRILLRSLDGTGERVVSARYVMIAVGSEATRDPRFPQDGRLIFSSDDMVNLDELPRTLAVVGGGVIGCEYACIFAALGVRVTLIDMRLRLLDFVDAEIAEALTYHMRMNRITLRLAETVAGAEAAETQGMRRVSIVLDSGKRISADKVLSSVGRIGASARLNLDAAGIQADSRGRIAVNEFYQTENPHIYAAGDVIGFPSLASTSMAQGRLAACHAFGVQARWEPALFPYGIFTIPEISFVGHSEEELTESKIPYEIGKAHYREIARGQILGDSIGMLKLIFHHDTRELLGVHIIGEGAVELVHIGQAVLAHRGKVDYFIENVFNYPTLAECYKSAAFDGINRLHG